MVRSTAVSVRRPTGRLTGTSERWCRFGRPLARITGQISIGVLECAARLAGSHCTRRGATAGRAGIITAAGHMAEAPSSSGPAGLSNRSFKQMNRRRRGRHTHRPLRARACVVSPRARALVVADREGIEPSAAKIIQHKPCRLRGPSLLGWRTDQGWFVPCGPALTRKGKGGTVEVPPLLPAPETDR